MNYTGQLKGHRGWVTSLSCPQDATSPIKVVSTSRDGTSIAWVENLDQEARESNYCVPDRRLEGHTGFVSSVSLAHSTLHAVTASWDHSLRLWNLNNGQSTGKFIGHSKDVLAVAFSPDDRQIVSGGRDNVLRVWNVMGECLNQFQRDQHSDWVSSICFSPSLDSPMVVSGSWDRTVKVWDITTGHCVRTLSGGHDNYITSVTISPDGSLCASGGADGIACLWDVASGDLLFKINVESPINQITFSPNRFWMCVAAEKSVRVYDLEAKSVIVELSPESDTAKLPECTCVAWSANGNMLFSGYTDNIIRAWSIVE